VVLTDKELKNIHQGVILTPTLYNQLKAWIHKYYRDRLKPTDLADPLLLLEVQEAYDKISHILDLKNIYS
jgi:succinylarginine dihydrolase